MNDFVLRLVLPSSKPSLVDSLDHQRILSLQIEKERGKLDKVSGLVNSLMELRLFSFNSTTAILIPLPLRLPLKKSTI